MEITQMLELSNTEVVLSGQTYEVSLIAMGLLKKKRKEKRHLSVSV